jgi:hypothetical protein
VLILMLNGGDETTPFRIPENGVASWDLLLDTSRDEDDSGVGVPEMATVPSGAPYPLEARSIALLRGIAR